MKKIEVSTVLETLSRFRSNFLDGRNDSSLSSQQPLQADLYSLEKLNMHGKAIAKIHRLHIGGHAKDHLLSRLDNNEKTLVKVRDLLVQSIQSGAAITPGAEWLLDNFYLIEEQIILARKHFPKGYSEGLPYLENGVDGMSSRVYNIVLEIISHSDGRVDMTNLSSFIESYQSCTVLTIGELWAVPIMLRLATIENLRRVCSNIALDMADHNLADYWTGAMITAIKDETNDIFLTISDMARSKPPLSGPFVAAFTRNLQGKGPSFVLPLNWLEQRLAQSGVNISDLVRQENQKQATDQVSVRNSIGTLRFIGATDWRKFVESLSLVEQILKLDPAGIYALMDFPTRDRYRHVVEDIAKRTSLSQPEVAQQVLDLASGYKNDKTPASKYAHVGYYLIDNGVEKTHLATRMTFTLGQRIALKVKKRRVAIYLLSIALLTIFAVFGMLSVVAREIDSKWLIVSLGLVCAVGMSQLAVAIVNWLSTIIVTPNLLPRMDFSSGIPTPYRTLVAIPTMLSSKAYIDELVESLEIRYLANKDNNLYFSLLTDFTDADTETTSLDDDLVQFATFRITELNKKYNQTDTDTFFLFHRPRKWNATEEKWMGYERKRGKLAALNALLKGAGAQQFSSVTGNYKVLLGIRYVITLDSDTQLPRESAWKFVATMAHPLNKPVYDPGKNRVTEGYTILQPRVNAYNQQVVSSLYLRMQGDVSGVDPYTRVSSDVYQDLFAEGSFIGKGIYDVEMFEQSLFDIFPENRILSHDLLEGCYARSGLLSDVFVYEHNPSEYSANIKRHYRWIRGDWQIALWVLPYVAGYNGKWEVNKLSVLSKWKIFDNLRRSILPLSLILILLSGWFLLPHPWLWTFSVTLILLMPAMITSCWQLVHKPADLTLSAHVSEIAISVWSTLVRFVFGLAILPYEAFRYTDAILRTIWRLTVSRKHLLEWTPSSDINRHEINNILSAYSIIWTAPLLAVVCIVILFANAPALLVASPILFLWLIAPALVYYISKPDRQEQVVLPERQTLFLHMMARKTWRFFEQLVTAEDNWLPPDNFQEYPVNVIAHRTSPTNMGLALMANLSAYDFGYISCGEFIRRCDSTINTMLDMERYKGHFFNWYDTRSLTPLHPRYVSTVDSGNLAGHLLTLRQGFLSLSRMPVINERAFEGLLTTLGIVQATLNKLSVELTAQIKTILATGSDNPASLYEIKVKLDNVIVNANELRAQHWGTTGESSVWVSKLLQQAEDIRKDLSDTIPWLEELPVPERFPLLSMLDQMLPLHDIADLACTGLHHIRKYKQGQNSQIEIEWLDSIKVHLLNAKGIATDKIDKLEQLAEHCERLSEIDYNFLFDKQTNLLRIGYNVDTQEKDSSFYDLLASEARLGVFVGIAQGKIPQESWFALGRLLTNSGGEPVLLSWSGSMFEYLMPQLVMPSFENTLLEQTSRATVRRQIDYARQQKIPWGISESAYNMVDASSNYQYRAFGIPGLGMKRGLEDDLVVAPYATMLALMVSPAEACANLQSLSKEGFDGALGFFEAIDYTVSRMARGKTHSVVRSYMAHHQGMSLLSMAYLLLGKQMQARFVSELRFQATLLLLQERIPRTTAFYAHTAAAVKTYGTITDVQVRSISDTNTSVPELQLLSNGRYHIIVSNSGGGYSRWKDIAITRWREDATKDSYGIFCYIKDVHTGHIWANTYQPTCSAATNYEAIFSQDHAEFRRVDHGIDVRTEIVISPEDDMEMRRVRITNKTSVLRTLEVTSYAEIVLASPASDEAHPAFSNLFVQTEIMREHKAIFCTRRPRSEEERPPWMVHIMNVHGATVEAMSYETDRLAFIGRGRTLKYPDAMRNDTLSGTEGAVLDPIVAVRSRISLKPNQTATIDLIYAVAETKAACQDMMYKYRDQHLKNRAFELSWTHSQVLLRQIDATEADAQIYDRLAGSIIYANSIFRTEAAVVLNNYRGQSGLWSHSVSGDIPIVLLKVYDPEKLLLVQQMLKAHTYWRLKGLAVDLVIWNEDHGSYRQLLHDQILGLITRESGNHSNNVKGNVFVRPADQISAEDRILFESVARVIISDKKGTLPEQVDKLLIKKTAMPLMELKPVTTYKEDARINLPDGLLFFNGKGGFSPDGSEYKILVTKEDPTPAPWINIIANAGFGSVVSESGSAYTWAVNAHEYRITPWSNDPVSDVGGEAIYLRNEETGHFWSPAPFAAGGKNPYLVTHGFGYTTFEHSENGIATEMKVFVDKDLPVKFISLRIVNSSGTLCTLSATGFMEIILGDVRSRTNMHIISEYDIDTGSLLFRNRYNTAFADRIAFFRINDVGNVCFTADRSEFIGRNRSLTDPQAMHLKKLSGKHGACMDTCAAMQTKFQLEDGAGTEIIFQIGSEDNYPKTIDLIRRISGHQTAAKSLQEVIEYWQNTLGAIQVVTPDPALNILTNGWLTYQTLACRIFARSGFYQSGGAFGFRDQLQDVLSLMHTQPSIVREQILLHASKQFTEGDVLHWWHPPEGRGVRTRCSDDLLWLPYAVSKYVTATGDKSILAMPVTFLEGRLLHAEEDTFYDLYTSGNNSGTLYEHCVRSIKHCLHFGKHGLPLIGSGDWNDGMDRVGNKGSGESIWLAFFLYDVLIKFSAIAQLCEDNGFANACNEDAKTLQQHIEASGWDGQWYIRAYFDDGTPLGSRENDECHIDAIAQSWSVLSGAANSRRAKIAMESLNRYLVDKELNIIRLLYPPFDSAKINPGYIKGYVPGVRENGGQYSHAAIWSLMAFAALGEREKVWELFSMVQPIAHAGNADTIDIYKVEPYVMAADVYANESHKGRGGWTWYTGSSGWMYQFIIGSLLGMERYETRLKFKPCFPLNWPFISIVYRYGKAIYNIKVFQLNSGSESWWKLDDKQENGDALTLIDDSATHAAEVYIG